jgi:HAD superfamily hydrolase (TIGR01450 family)
LITVWLTRCLKFQPRNNPVGADLHVRPFLLPMLSPLIKSLILDMDGVLWKADAPIGNLPSVFDRIRACGLKVAFATNNSTLTPNQYVERLSDFGVAVEVWQVVTSSLGVAHLLSQKFPSGGKVYAIGEVGLMLALREKGFEPLPLEEARRAQALVMGFDRSINFAKMSEAALLVRHGVPFYATNPDKTFPTPRGEIPGAGAWVSVIATATGIQPIYAGKPAPYMLELARERLGTAREETLVVGDRLETDIAGGQHAGCPVALILSGVSTREQGKAWTPKVDIIVKDLTTLLKEGFLK